MPPCVKKKSSNATQDFYTKTVKSGFFKEVNIRREECNDTVESCIAFLTRCLNLGYDLNCVNKQKDNLLIWMCKSWEGAELIRIVDFLAIKGINVNYFNPKTGINALVAVIKSYKNVNGRSWADVWTVASLLVKLGININHVDMTGTNVLWEVCKTSELSAREVLSLIELFISYGVEIHQQAPVRSLAPNVLLVLLSARGRKERDPEETLFLHVIVDLFIKLGVEINATMPDGSNAIMLIAKQFFRPPILMSDMLGIMHTLVYNDININAVDVHGKNVLNSLCCSNHNFEDKVSNAEFHSALRLLINKGIDVNSVDDKGNNALLNLVQSTKLTRTTLPLMKLLLKAGIDCRLVNKSGKDVWHLICAKKDVNTEVFVETCELLVLAGAEVPLTLLRSKLSEEEIQALVARGREKSNWGIITSEYENYYYGLELSDDE